MFCKKIVLKLSNILYRKASSCVIFDGKEASKFYLASLKEKVFEWKSKGNRSPHLSVVLVGDDPASLSYTRIKSKVAAKVGITSDVFHLKDDISQNELIKVIQDLNYNKNVDGILVQLPLPSHLDEYAVSNTIFPAKDVDGFTQLNMGRLSMNSPFFIPCTALAVYKMIENIGVDTTGKHALVCGRSKHVGLPIFLLLHSSAKTLNMTTTICHRHTPKNLLKNLTKQSDFIISAAGLPGLITGDMIKEGAVVIDVGITRIHKEGSKADFIGDVVFEDVKNIANFITPVPGGVGPITVAMLMENTLKAARFNSEIYLKENKEIS